MTSTSASPAPTTAPARRPSVIELVCAWSGVGFMAFFGLGFVVLARFVPPPNPEWGADRIVEYIDDNRFGIRIGMLVCLFAAALFVPFFIYVSAHIARIERGFPFLATMQAICAAVLVTFFTLNTILWAAMTFREGQDPDVLQMINDLSWFCLVMLVPTFAMQCFCIAAAGLRYAAADDPIFPRWFSYLTLWQGPIACGGALAVFFKDGAFAWNGAVGFYLPLPVFGVWVFVWTVMLHRGVKAGLLADRFGRHD